MADDGSFDGSLESPSMEAAQQLHSRLHEALPSQAKSPQLESLLQWVTDSIGLLLPAKRLKDRVFHLTMDADGGRFA